MDLNGGQATGGGSNDRWMLIRSRGKMTDITPVKVEIQ